MLESIKVAGDEGKGDWLQVGLRNLHGEVEMFSILTVMHSGAYILLHIIWTPKR